jgi:hypothetical protein
LPFNVNVLEQYKLFFEHQYNLLKQNEDKFYRSDYDYDADFIQWFHSTIELVLIRYGINPNVSEIKQKIICYITSDQDKFYFCYLCFFLRNMSCFETHIFFAMSIVVGIIYSFYIDL